MFNVTVTEAAERLGISRTRVHQLIKDGALIAEKAGNMWLIDDTSLEKRIADKPKAGRPKPAAHRRLSDRFVLMNREHEILTFRFDSATGSFYDTDEIHDSSRAPFGVLSPRGKRVSKDALASWWAHRTIPKGRTGIEAKLSELGISQTFDLPFKSMGLSLSDQYWIKPEGTNVSWADINFFDNRFSTTKAGLWLSEVGLDSPDNTSDGMLSKTWICRGKRRLLLKGGTLLNQEPYNERVATCLGMRILEKSDYVPYSLEKWGATVVSSCPEFLTNTEEYIPALYIKNAFKKPEHKSDFRHFIECCERLGVHDAELALQKMIVCDDLVANTDRHWRNFGLIRDVEMLEYRMAPLFDSGTSLWCTLSTQNLNYSSFDFASKPFSDTPNDQLRLVSDFSWLNLDTLTGFAEEAVDILEENPLLEGRLDFIFEGIQRRVYHLRAIAE